MKFIISGIKDKLGLIKFFRKHDPELGIMDVKAIVENLPFEFTDLRRYQVDELEEKLKNVAFYDYKLELDDMDPHQAMMYNSNIQPPEDYIKAMAWHDLLSEEEKAHIEAIINWRSRPAVC